MRKKVQFAAIVLSTLFAAPALAVSVGELIKTCGDDGKAYCEGVGYGDPMQQCLDKNYEKLTPQCKGVMDRIREGERVSLF